MNNNRKQLRKAILGIIGTAALAGISTQASAFDSLSLGTFTSSAISVNSSSGIRSYADYGTNVNFGWVHTVDWWTLQVGSAADIAAGNTYDVQFRMTPNNSASAPMFNPGFSIWTSGTNPVINGAGFHEWSQVRGPNDGGVHTNDALGNPGNIIDGHNGWIGTANAGPGFTNGDGDAINNGALWNTASPYFNASASSGEVGTLYSSNNFGVLNLFDLKAGHYLIAAGGSCADEGPGYGGSTCLQQRAKDYTFTVSTAPVPVPAAVWLFGSSLAGMGIIGRRKEKQAV